MRIAIRDYMIYSRLNQLIAEKEFREKRKITYKVIQDETGLSSNTIAKLMSLDPVQRIDGTTLDKLCDFLGCQVGDLLVHTNITYDEKSDAKRYDSWDDNVSLHETDEP